MIKYNGYYVSSAYKTSDSRSQNIWYTRKAFVFLKDNTMLWSIKHFKNKSHKKFLLEDFKSDGGFSFQINGNEICQLIYKGNPVLESKIYFDIISEDELKYKDSENILEFISF